METKTVTLVFTPQIEGGYVAQVAELPGALSEGDTLDEAVLNLCEALTGVLNYYREDKRPVPWAFAGTGEPPK